MALRNTLLYLALICCAAYIAFHLASRAPADPAFVEAVRKKAFESDQCRSERHASWPKPATVRIGERMRVQSQPDGPTGGYVPSMKTRDVPDYRPPKCKDLSAPHALRDAFTAYEYCEGACPPLSIIICFRNETTTLLERTVKSYLYRTPPELLKEIILIDDHNEPGERVDERIFKLPKVKVIFNEEREGLIRSRLKGARAATAPVLYFSDAHCEATLGWAEPLLDVLTRDYTKVAVPFIDIIDDISFQWGQMSRYKGVFDVYSMTFKWAPITGAQRARDASEPFTMPAMPGGIFAITKKWFWESGGYDSKQWIWGGENVEMSLRLWTCGGSIWAVPCSRVGHVFRAKTARLYKNLFPYSFPGGTSEVVTENNIRTAMIWMDGFQEVYLRGKPANWLQKERSLVERRQLRSRLGCRWFGWYVENVYPDVLPKANANQWKGYNQELFNIDPRAETWAEEIRMGQPWTVPVDLPGDDPSRTWLRNVPALLHDDDVATVSPADIFSGGHIPTSAPMVDTITYVAGTFFLLLAVLVIYTSMRGTDRPREDSMAKTV